MQIATSKFTSVNSSRLPAVYNKINFEKIKRFLNVPFPTILDYGCGRYTQHIQNFIPRDFLWQGYDPYWSPINIENKYFDIIVCSNVFNVIDDEQEVIRIHQWIKKHSRLYFITTYKGDKSDIGRYTKKDCYQSNRLTECYGWTNEKIKKDVICSLISVLFIK